MKPSVLFFVLGFIFPSFVNAQTHTCGTGEKESVDFRAFNQGFHSLNRSTGGPTMRIIPVAVNIIYDSQYANISDAQVNDGIDVLNDAFGGIYGGVNTNIQFCLAGINRAEDANLAYVVKRGNEFDAKALIGEDPFRYLNVWLVEELREPDQTLIFGWTPYPQFLNTFPDLDGIMLFHRAWGSIGSAENFEKTDEGKIAVHEVGHWLGLLHTFDGGCDYAWNCNTEGDCCCDTPPQSQPYYKCKPRRNSCNTDSPDERDPIHNYMGYTPDACRYEFTQCQADRMNFYLENIRFDAFFETGDCPMFKKGEQAALLPGRLVLEVAPNPVVGTAHIGFALPQAMPYTLALYDARGVQLQVRQGLGQQGDQRCDLDLAGQAPGLYFVRLVAGGRAATVRLVVQ